MSTFLGLIGGESTIIYNGNYTAPINGMAQFANAPILHTEADLSVWLKAGNVATDVENYPDTIKEYVGLQGLHTPINNLIRHGTTFQTQKFQYSSDGLFLFIYGGNVDIVKYILTTPYDMSTATWHSEKDGIVTNLYTARITYSGEYLIVTDQYRDVFSIKKLDTAWDITSITDMGSTGSSMAEITAGDISSLAMSEDGTKVYVHGFTVERVYEYTLSTPYNANTLTYSGSFISVNAPCYSIELSPDGGYFFAVYENYIARWTLATPYSFVTQTGKITFYTAGLNVGISIATDGLSMYSAPAGVYSEYTFGTAWDVTTLTKGVSPSTAHFYQALNSTVGIFFKPDGLKCYAVSYGDLSTITLSVAWDMSTITGITDYKSILTSTTSGKSIFIRDNGLELYIPNSSNAIDKYTLSVAWDMSTLLYVSEEIFTEDTQLKSIFFKPDGTKMYVAGISTDTLYQYTLSTPWDMSSKTLDTPTFYMGSYFAGMIYFNPDGLTFFWLYTNGNSLREVALSVAWDIGARTSKPNSVNLNLPTGERQCFFSPDGSKLFLADDENIKEYTYDPNQVGLADATGLDPHTYVRIK